MRTCWLTRGSWGLAQTLQKSVVFFTNVNASLSQTIALFRKLQNFQESKKSYLLKGNQEINYMYDCYYWADVLKCME